MGRRPLPKWIAPLIAESLTSRITWGISSPFGPLSPASGQVTNALLTRSPLGNSVQVQSFLVRLACIRHAASVHPEPGSNSPQENRIRRCVSYVSFCTFLLDWLRFFFLSLFSC